MPDLASQSIPASQAIVRFEKQISIGSVGSLWVGRFLNGSDAGRTVVLRRISRQWLSARDASWVSNAVAGYSKVRHPSLLKLLGVLEQDDDLVSVSEHMEGVRLVDLERSVFEEGVPIPATVAVRIVLDAARATWKAHRLAADVGIFPTERLFLTEGILVAGYGGTLLTEVGVLSALARCVAPRKVAGLLGQLAPEELGARTAQVGSPEVFSLGVVLWELLANRWLFDHESDLRAHEELLGSPIQDLDQIERFGMPVPGAIVDLVRKATERNPSKRFASVNDLVLALESLPAHFVAAEHQVGEVVRQRAGAMLKDSRAEDTERGRSGTFAEVRSSPTSESPPPQATNSVAPPSISSHDWDRPTLAQSSLVSKPPCLSSVIPLTSTNAPSTIITDPDPAASPSKPRHRRAGVVTVAFTLVAAIAGAVLLRERLPLLPHAFSSPAPAARVAPAPVARKAPTPERVTTPPAPVQPSSDVPSLRATTSVTNTPDGASEPKSNQGGSGASKIEPEPPLVVSAKPPVPQKRNPPVARKPKAPHAAKVTHEPSAPATAVDPQWGI